MASVLDQVSGLGVFSSDSIIPSFIHSLTHTLNKHVLGTYQALGPPWVWGIELGTQARACAQGSDG